jgi:hypothetical protein
MFVWSAVVNEAGRDKEYAVRQNAGTIVSLRDARGKAIWKVSSCQINRNRRNEEARM